MSTGTWLGATVATLQSVGTGLALSTNAALAGVGGVIGGVIARSKKSAAAEPAPTAVADEPVVAEEPAVVDEPEEEPPRDDNHDETASHKE